VMTTLDRLFKKGLLNRVKRDRAFLYSPAVSPADLENLRAHALITRFLDRPNSTPDVLLSCLIDVMSGYDDALLDSMEEKIKAAKQRLEQQRLETFRKEN
jgi:predicted transcriptional regulator